MGHATSRFRTQSRRATDWFSGPRGVLATTTAQTQPFLTGVTNFQDGQTIIRIRGECLLSLSGGPTAVEGFGRVGIGICMVTTKAAGIGTTAIPAPLTEMTWDGWMFHWVGALISNIDTAWTGAEGSMVVRVPVETKAMRKVGEDRTMVAMLQTAGLVGTGFTLNGDLNTRCLLKLA